MTLRSPTPERTSPSHVRADQYLLKDNPREMVEVTGDKHAEALKAKERRHSPDMVANVAIRLSESPIKADSLPSTDVTIQGDTSPTIRQFEVEQRVSRTGSSIKTVVKDSLEIEEKESSLSQAQPIEQKGQKQKKRPRKAATGKLSKERDYHPNDMNFKGSVTKLDLPRPQSSKPSTHKRFDREEPGVSNSAETEAALQPSSPPPHVSIEDDTSDSDSAPEAITKSTSTHLAQSTAIEISKAIAEKAAAEKSKRRKRNEALKLQAQTSTKRPSQRHRLSLSPPPQKRLTLGDPLPDLLPDYILQSTPGERLPTPPPAKATAAHQPNKLRFLDKEEKRPKDVKKGGVTVRVLESKGRLNLPPRANKSSRNLRERWLSGVRKGVQMERESWKRSVVRR